MHASKEVIRSSKRMTQRSVTTHSGIIGAKMQHGERENKKANTENKKDRGVVDTIHDVVIWEWEVRARNLGEIAMLQKNVMES